MKKTYGWNGTLAEEVPVDGTVDLPAPGLDEYALPDTADTAINSDVYDDTQAPVAFDPEADTLTVTNRSGVAWPAGAGIYVSASSQDVTAGDIGGGGGDTEALEARIAALEASQGTQDTTVAALDARVAAVEASQATQDTAIADLTARVTALETPVTTTASGRRTKNGD